MLGEIVGYLVAVAVLPTLGTLRYSELRREMGNITDAVLVSMGGAPKASILLGKGENERAEKVMGSCTWVLLLLSALLTGVMLAFGRPILLIFGASAEGCAWDLKNVRVRIPYAVGVK